MLIPIYQCPYCKGEEGRIELDTIRFLRNKAFNDMVVIELHSAANWPEEPSGEFIVLGAGRKP